MPNSKGLFAIAAVADRLSWTLMARPTWASFSQSPPSASLSNHCDCRNSTLTYTNYLESSSDKIQQCVRSPVIQIRSISGDAVRDVAHNLRLKSFDLFFRKNVFN